MKKASIIIPTYNQSEFLAQAIESTLYQTYLNLEIIVVNDGSTDNTPAVISSFGQRIKHVYQKNKGHSAARNAGYRISEGEYLLFLDSDDILLPGALETSISFLEAHHDYGLVYAAWQSINENNTQVLDEVRQNKQGYLLKELLLRQISFIPSVTTIRRIWLEKIDHFDESMVCNADTDLWTRLAYSGCKFGYIDTVLLKRRIHKQSVSMVEVNPVCVKNRFSTLNKVFFADDLPEEIESIQAEAYSILHYECAARYYHVGQIGPAQSHIRHAITTCPTLAANQEWLLEWIAGYALGPRVEDGPRLINTIFNNLPVEAISLHLLKRKAFGRYYAAAAFAAYAAQNFKKVQKNVFPAIIKDPTILGNKGFISISLKSLIG